MTIEQEAEKLLKTWKIVDGNYWSLNSCNTWENGGHASDSDLNTWLTTLSLLSKLAIAEREFVRIINHDSDAGKYLQYIAQSALEAMKAI